MTCTVENSRRSQLLQLYLKSYAGFSWLIESSRVKRSHSGVKSSQRCVNPVAAGERVGVRGFGPIDRSEDPSSHPSPPRGEGGGAASACYHIRAPWRLR